MVVVQKNFFWNNTTMATAMNFEDLEIILSVGDSECSRCKVYLEEGMGIMLLTCLHPYCRSCIEDLTEASSEYRIMCPVVERSTLNVMEECQGYFLYREIKAVVSEVIFKQYCSRLSQPISSNVEKIRRQPEANFSKVTKRDELNSKSVGRLNSRKLPQEYRDLVQDEDENICLSIKLCEVKTQCGFCTINIEAWDGIILQTCNHTFCRDCLKTKICASDGSQVECPLADETKCYGYLSEMEIKCIVPQGAYEEYLQKSIRKVQMEMTNIFSCKTKGCSGWCELEDDSRKVFLCLLCNASNCIQCKASHDGVDCRHYQSLLSNAQQAGHSNNSTEFKRNLDKERKEGFYQLSDTVLKWMSPLASTRDSHSNGKHNMLARHNTADYSDILGIMEQMDVIPTSKEFECSICLMDVNEGIVLFSCLHTFCRECLRKIVEYSDEPEIKCPYLDGNYSCISYLLPREIKALVTPELYEDFINRSIKKAEEAIPNTFHCLRPNCQGWCEIEPTARFFWCQVCEQENCIRCKAVHETMTCEGYHQKLEEDRKRLEEMRMAKEKQEASDAMNRLIQQENELKGVAEVEKLLSNRTFNRCPNCNMVCYKYTGCDQVVCGGCKHRFVWRGQ